MPPLETHTSPLNSNPFSINHSNMPSSVRAARRNTTLLLLLCLNVWLVSGRRRKKTVAGPFIVSSTHLTVTVRAPSALILAACWASTLLDRTYMKAQTNLLLSAEIKKSLKMEESGRAERAQRMRGSESERARAPAKYPLCSSPPSLEEPLITVQVKLNMREISRAAGVGGWEVGGWRGWGGQSRGASEGGPATSL